MKAITVEPKQPGTTRMEDVPEPTGARAQYGRSHRRRRLRDRRRNCGGENGWALPARRASYWATRIPRPCAGPGRPAGQAGEISW